MKLKYIIDEMSGFSIFAEYVQHDMAARPFQSHSDIVGAGFVSFTDGAVVCYGESISLNIKSRGFVDSTIIAEKLDLKVGN